MITWHTYRIAREGQGADSWIEIAHLKGSGFLIRDKRSDHLCFVPSTMSGVQEAAEQWELKPNRD